MKRLGSIIVFEGPDSIGKSTISEGALQSLQNCGVQCVLFSFPGKEKGTLGKLVYEMHHKPRKFGIKSISHAALQTMHVAAHLDALENRIIPCLEVGKTVILDRWWWSTFVYGSVFGVDQSLLKALIKAELTLLDGIKPSVVYLVSRPSPFDKRVESQQWRQLVIGYRKLARSEEKKCKVRIVRNDRPIPEVVNQILKELLSSN